MRERERETDRDRERDLDTFCYINTYQYLEQTIPEYEWPIKKYVTSCL